MQNIIIAGVIVLVLLGGGYWYLSQNEAAVNNDTERSAATTTAENENIERSNATLEAGTYRVDEDRSTITWQAGKPAIAGYVHTGRFSINQGSFNVASSSLEGEVTIDMNSLELLSLGGGKAGQESTLEGHLKGERFFDVANHPTATFTLTDISPKILPGPNQMEYTATGELTMKGVTKDITFPMRVIVDSANEAVMEAEFSIDRTEWGLTAGSAKVAEAITDQIIGDTVDIELSVLLQK